MCSTKSIKEFLLQLLVLFTTLLGVLSLDKYSLHHPFRVLCADIS